MVALDSEEIEKYIKAGEIAARVRELAEKYAKPGMKIIELAEYVENKIIELGGKPAFPCNISINEEAAHRTPVIDDELVIPDNSVVKVDIGVHIDGYIADTATTLNFNPQYEGLVLAVEEALEKALSIIGPGVKINQVGRIIEELLRRRGFRPIRNLSGHSLLRYTIHGGTSIPNTYEPLLLSKFRSGEAYAIEPFGTDGVGYVVESNITTIYALSKIKARGLTREEQLIFNHIKNEYRTLPFTERWLTRLLDKNTLRNAIRRLYERKIIRGYPILVEASKSMVAQFEHTVLILDKEVIITTKLK